MGRRNGDVSRVVANNNKMISKYNWKPKLGDIDYIISTALNWEKQKLKLLYEN